MATGHIEKSTKSNVETGQSDYSSRCLGERNFQLKIVCFHRSLSVICHSWYATFCCLNIWYCVATLSFVCAHFAQYPFKIGINKT